MCPNTPYLGGLWASCPLRYPRRCFSLGGSHFEEGWDQAGGQSPGSLIVGASAQPLTSSCGGTSPLFSKALWWVGGVVTRAHGRWEQLCPGGWECKRPEVGAGPSGPAPFCQSSLPPVLGWAWAARGRPALLVLGCGLSPAVHYANDSSAGPWCQGSSPSRQGTWGFPGPTEGC